MANYQLIQNTLKKYSFYFTFLASNNRDIAMEVRNEYLDTQSKALFSYFKSYSGRLAKLQYDDVATKDDLMGVPDEAGTRTMSGFFGKTNIKSKASVFSMGSRAEILGEKFHAPSIVPHVQQKSETKFPYEVLFWSEQYCLMTTACNEYSFVKEFFNCSTNEAWEFFQQIMGKSLGILMKNIDLHIQESYDGISLYLCINLVHKFNEICKSQCGNVTDKYWDNIHGILWNRLTSVIEMNIQSISEVDPLKVKAA